MKITNKAALKLYDDANGKSKQEKIKSATNNFLNQYKIFDSNFDVLRLRFSRFSRLMLSKPKNNRDGVMENWNSSIFYEHVAAGRPSKRLSDGPCTKKQRDILDKMVGDIENFAQDEGVSKEEALALIVDECNRKWKINDAVQKGAVPDDTSLSVMFNVGLSISQYQRLHTICSPYTKFATRNTIDKMKKTLHPPITGQEIKASVNLGFLQKQTFKAICKGKNIWIRWLGWTQDSAPEH